MVISKHTDRYFEVATRLLDVPEMSLGGQALRKLVFTQDELPASFPRSYAWHVLESATLVRPPTRESLLLFAERPSHEDIRDAWKITTDKANCNGLVCVVPDEAKDIVNGHPEGVAIWTASTLFERILRLPSNFRNQLSDVAAIQRPDEFQFAFQKRNVSARNFARGERPAPTEGVLQYFCEWLRSPSQALPHPTPW